MDIVSLLGIIMAIAALYFGAPDVSLNPKVYLQYDSFTFVFVGSIAAMLISSSLLELKHLIELLTRGYIGKKIINAKKTVTLMIGITQEVQKTSKQNLPTLAKQYNNPFLTEATNMVASGLEDDFVLKTLDNEINEIERRHEILINKIKSMAAYATMFGMTGTILGVIQVLKDVKDVENIVSGLSLALLTTLYGLLLSTLLYLPMSKKLRNKSEAEILHKFIIREGIMLIQNKEIPLKAKYYLNAYVEQKQRDVTKT